MKTWADGDKCVNIKMTTGMAHVVTTANMKTAKGMATVFVLGLMATDTKASGKVTNNEWQQ
jgi:hypothetical protein